MLAKRVSGFRDRRRGRIHLARPQIRRLRRRLKITYERIHGSLASARLASPAEEWLLDNRHIVEDALETLGRTISPIATWRPGPDPSIGRSSGRTVIALGLFHAEALALEFCPVPRAILPIDLDGCSRQIDCYQDSGPF